MSICGYAERETVTWVEEVEDNQTRGLIESMWAKYRTDSDIQYVERQGHT
jgi:hypothetical protein